MRETQVVYRCDVCDAPGAQTCDFRIQKQDPWRADLCEKHLKIVFDLMQSGARVVRKPHPGRGLTIHKKKPATKRAASRK